MQNGEVGRGIPSLRGSRTTSDAGKLPPSAMVGATADERASAVGVSGVVVTVGACYESHSMPS